MLNDFILKQPKDIRKNCKVDDTRVCIPLRLPYGEVCREFGSVMSNKDEKAIRAIAVASMKKPMRRKPIHELLQTGGR